MFLAFKTICLTLALVTGLAVASPVTGADSSDRTPSSSGDSAEDAGHAEADHGTEAGFEAPVKPKAPKVRGPLMSNDGDPNKDPNMEVDPD